MSVGRSAGHTFRGLAMRLLGQGKGESMEANSTPYSLPEIVDRATWQAEVDRVLVREKAHTREGDAIAAARRRLPMVEVDAQTPLVGAQGPVPLVAAFEG